jgi:hypothetical protein
MESNSFKSRLANAGNPMASVTQRSNNLKTWYKNMKQKGFKRVKNPGHGTQINTVHIKTNL